MVRRRPSVSPVAPLPLPFQTGTCNQTHGLSPARAPLCVPPAAIPQTVTTPPAPPRPALCPTLNLQSCRLFTLGVLCYLDRTNLSFAALELNRDLHLSCSTYGLGASLFFVSYALFQLPSTLACARLGAPTWLGINIVAWGLVAASFSLARGVPSFLTLRFLLGATESAAFPGKHPLLPAPTCLPLPATTCHWRCCCCVQGRGCYWRTGVCSSSTGHHPRPRRPPHHLLGSLSSLSSFPQTP